MKLDWDILDDEEKRKLAFRSLYLSRGFTRYRMGKFEAYDLYSRNKDFLLTDQVITFTDTNGVLMALKPDVTLSIVRNVPDEPEALQKLCYDENVYRVAQGSGAFRELAQTGLECIGKVDAACVGEVLRLAAESLALCSPDYVLEVSDLDILSAFVDGVSVEPSLRRALLRSVSEKNAHAIQYLAGETGADAEKTEALLALLNLYGPAGEVLPKLSALCEGLGLDEAIRELREALSVFPAEERRVQLDFSAVGNMKYYNGVLFRGFIRGISAEVISGGRYDRLMQRMKKRSGAVGFAVYLDRLERQDFAENGGGEA